MPGEFLQGGNYFRDYWLLALYTTEWQSGFANFATPILGKIPSGSKQQKPQSLRCLTRVSQVAQV